MPAANERCETCAYFLLHEESTGKGICRLNPPLPVLMEGCSPSPEDVHGTRWPVCWQGEWCGQWKKA